MEGLLSPGIEDLSVLRLMGCEESGLKHEKIVHHRGTEARRKDSLGRNGGFIVVREKGFVGFKVNGL